MQQKICYSITKLPAHKLKNQEGKEVKPKVAEANPEEWTLPPILEN